jgi:hypothetical protein
MNKHGIGVNGYQAENICKTCRAIFISLNKGGSALKTWSQARYDAIQYYRQEMYRSFPDLCLCDDDWKVNQLAINEYPGFSRSIAQNTFKQETTDEVPATDQPDHLTPTTCPLPSSTIDRKPKHCQDFSAMETRKKTKIHPEDVNATTHLLQDTCMQVAITPDPIALPLSTATMTMSAAAMLPDSHSSLIPNMSSPALPDIPITLSSDLDIAPMVSIADTTAPTHTAAMPIINTTTAIHTTVIHTTAVPTTNTTADLRQIRTLGTKVLHFHLYLTCPP